MVPQASLPDTLYAQIRVDITRGRVVSGDRLRQDHLATRFGVSHIPVREALAKLAAEGFVVLQPRRGAVVAPVSATEVEQINEMRVLLEPRALAYAVANVTPALIGEARAIIDRIDRAPQRWGELNAAFHRLLYRASGRERLCEMIDALHRNVERYLHLEAGVVGNLAASQREHRRLLRLLERRDVEAATELLVAHIAEPGALLARHLRENGTP